MIEKNIFWRVVNKSRKPIGEVLSQVKITAEGIHDPNGVVFECLSIPTKDFVRGMRQRHNKGSNKLYKQVLSNDCEATRYNLQLQASLYSSKLSEADRAVFEEETRWKEATKDEVFAWIKQIFERVR